MVSRPRAPLPPRGRQQATSNTSLANLVWELASTPPPLPVPASSNASYWTTCPSHVKPLCEHAKRAPVLHPRHTPTDRAPPSPHARVITTTPATPQTRPFAVARTTR